MNQSEKHSFEQEWQRAFEPAAEPPPPAAWGAIEARLDAPRAPAVTPLWWRRPAMLYAAAAVAALLLLSWPAWRQTQQNTSPTLSGTGAPAGVALTPGRASVPIDRPAARPAAAEAQPGQERPSTAQTLAARPSRPSSGLAPVSAPSRALRTPLFYPSPAQMEPRVSGYAVAAGASDDTPATPDTRKLTPETTDADAVVALAPVSFAPIDSEPIHLGDLSLPHSSTVRPLAIGPLNRATVAAPQLPALSDEDEAEADASLPIRRSRKLWASLGIMPASFDPRLSVTAAPMAFTQAQARREPLASASRGRLSYAVQLLAGKRLSRRWTVETGVSYLQGNSEFRSPGYLLDATTNRSAGLLEEALLANVTTNKTTLPGFGGTDVSSTIANSYISFDQVSDNDYQYVQMPVQAGYTINPDSRFACTLLGGMVANFFVQNQVQSSQRDMFSNRPEDGLYRALSWSASSGVRVSYRLSDRLDATLTGTYQKAVGSILRDNQTLDSRPQLYGLGWGVRYVF